VAIVGLPAPLDTNGPPAMPTGDRTIAHPRRLVNASRLDSRTLSLFCRLSFFIDSAIIRRLGHLGGNDRRQWERSVAIHRIHSTPILVKIRHGSNCVFRGYRDLASNHRRLSLGESRHI
jgi:hypothetical protein